ncbi:MAG: hypothetical protein M3157_02120 [Actinomycetota bacterium]|nr:hypothetical protein [Actinomycetota bacterium]
MFDYLQGPQEGYVLLGRMEGEVPGYLSYGAEEGEVLCVFRGLAKAEEFYEFWKERIPGEGWGPVRLDIEGLAEVVENFDLVSVDPRPVPGTTEYLLPAGDFIRSLREPL